MKISFFYNKIKLYASIHKEKTDLYIIFYIYHQIFTKMLNVNKNISKDVKLFLSKSHESFIGIQIRIGNADLNEKQFSNSTDVDIMLRIAKKNKQYKKWFVTGDSFKLKRKLNKKYKNIFLFTKNKTKHYANNKKDSSIIIEHEILSKSNLIIISESTFGLTALLKSGILLKDNCTGYEIKKGITYDVKLNFRNITSLWNV